MFFSCLNLQFFFSELNTAALKSIKGFMRIFTTKSLCWDSGSAASTFNVSSISIKLTESLTFLCLIIKSNSDYLYRTSSQQKSSQDTIQNLSHMV